MKTGFAAAAIVSAMLALGVPAAWAKGPESVAPLAVETVPAEPAVTETPAETPAPTETTTTPSAEASSEPVPAQ